MKTPTHIEILALEYESCARCNTTLARLRVETAAREGRPWFAAVGSGRIKNFRSLRWKCWKGCWWRRLSRSFMCVMAPRTT